MTKAKIVELDFGMGNIRSLQKAFEHLGKDVTVSGDPKVAAEADVLLLPGDGAFARAMEEIQKRDLLDVIRAAHEKKKVIFGICIGFQLLFESSTEFAGAATPGAGGLSFVKGGITRLTKNAEAPVIPHVGWTTTDFSPASKLGRGIGPGQMFYYVHSFAAQGKHPHAAATTYYGQTFTSALEHENLYAVQFHPEKSHNAGLRLIQNFLSAL